MLSSVLSSTLVRVATVTITALSMSEGAAPWSVAAGTHN